MSKYNGVLRKPFLSEHWHKGFVAAAAIWLPVFWLLSSGFELYTPVAIGIASFISLIVATAVFTHYTGFAIDTKQQRYRSYIWILGLHIGKWQKLPHISHVLIKPYKKRHILPLDADYTSSSLVANELGNQVLLSVFDSKIGIVAAYASPQKALCIANTLSKTLKVTIVEVTHS